MVRAACLALAVSLVGCGDATRDDDDELPGVDAAVHGNDASAVSADAAVGVDADVSRPDADVALPDGSVSLPDGSVPLPDGSVPSDAAVPPDAADAAVPPDATVPMDAAADAAIPPDATVIMDAGLDAAVSLDATVIMDAGTPSTLTGGPCISGAPGATAYRVRWTNAGGSAQVVYEVNGLPDTSRDHTGAFGFTIPFTPSYVDTFLAEGGLQLNSSSFVDIELSTAGVTTITSATLSIYGRSFNTTASGSFNWQTFAGLGAAPTNLVSNAAPYAWYSADMTSQIDPGDDSVLLRIKSGPSSNSLAVHRIELCMVAE